MANLPFQGGHNPIDSMAELKGYYFDLAAVTSLPQLAALNAFVSSSQLVIGSDSTLSYLPTQWRWFICLPLGLTRSSTDDII